MKQKTTSTAPSIEESLLKYLEIVKNARSERTFRTYAFALKRYLEILQKAGIQADFPVSELKSDSILLLIKDCKNLRPMTERLLVSAVRGFFEYLAAEEIGQVNMARVSLLVKQRGRRAGMHLPPFPRDQIEQVLRYVDELKQQPAEDKRERLIDLRDRALLLTLSDTGLRIHEACALKRGDIDWQERRTVITGKGNKEAVVRFSDRAIRALREYLAEREDNKLSKPLYSQPLFAMHSKRAGVKTVKPISTTTGRRIVARRKAEAGVEVRESEKPITPHSFRHYFVTTVLRSSGNLKMAQELARHSDISTTQRYAHLSNDELDRGYERTFARRKKTPG